MNKTIDDQKKNFFMDFYLPSAVWAIEWRNVSVSLFWQNNETTWIGIGVLDERRVLTILSRNISRAESDELPSLIK